MIATGINEIVSTMTTGIITRRAIIVRNASIQRPRQQGHDHLSSNNHATAVYSSMVCKCCTNDIVVFY